MPQKYKGSQNYYKQLYINKVEKFLETYNFTKLKQEEIENMNRLITSNEGESGILKLLQTKVQDQLLHRQILTHI